MYELFYKSISNPNSDRLLYYRNIEDILDLCYLMN